LWGDVRGPSGTTELSVGESAASSPAKISGSRSAEVFLRLCTQGNALPQTGQVMSRFGDFARSGNTAGLDQILLSKTYRVNLPVWSSTACVPNISLLSQQGCFVTCLPPCP